jgi:hypothetical protein
LEVKAEDVCAMMAAIKSNISPGNFVPFHMRSANEVAFEKEASYVASKNANTWSFLINYVSKGSFFKLENKVKHALHIDHIIYDPVNKTMKVLIAKKLFDQSREIIRHSLQKWCQELDPDDTRHLHTLPEIAYLAQDDFSKSSNSYTSHSIASILSFEIEEIEVRKTNTTVTAPIIETTPSDLSDPAGQAPAITEVSRLKEEVKKYQQELEKCTIQMEKFRPCLRQL